VDLRAEAHIAGRFGFSHPTSRFDRRINVVVSIFHTPIPLIFGFDARPDGVGKCESWSYCTRIDKGWCCCFESPPFAKILTIFFLWSSLVVVVVWRAHAHIAERFAFSHPISLLFLSDSRSITLYDNFIFFCGSGAGAVVPADLRAEAHIAGRFGVQSSNISICCLIRTLLCVCGLLIFLPIFLQRICAEEAMWG
jgi:hypothetical protein